MRLTIMTWTGLVPQLNNPTLATTAQLTREDCVKAGQEQIEAAINGGVTRITFEIIREERDAS